MGKSNKLGMDVEMEYLQAAMDRGDCTIQEVSMKVLGNPDTDYQARVVHLDMDHVGLLLAKYNVHGSLDPVVIFRDRTTEAMKLADGFHRHEVFRSKKLRSIRAYVIDTDDLIWDALFYATMCNQKAYLKRSPGDVRKAVRMLLEEPSWFKGSLRAIADHVGVSSPLVKRVRLEFVTERGEALPPGRKRYAEPRILQKTDGYYFARIRGRVVSLVKDPVDDERRFQLALRGEPYPAERQVAGGRRGGLAPLPAEASISFHAKYGEGGGVFNGDLSRFLNVRNVLVVAAGNKYPLDFLGRAWTYRRHVLVASDLEDTNTVAEAFGRAVMNISKTGSRGAIVACTRNHIPNPAVQSLAKKFHIKFVPIDDVVAHLESLPE